MILQDLNNYEKHIVEDINKHVLNKNNAYNGKNFYVLIGKLESKSEIFKRITVGDLTFKIQSRKLFRQDNMELGNICVLIVDSDKVVLPYEISHIFCPYLVE